MTEEHSRTSAADDVRAAYPAPLRGDSLGELEEQLASASDRLAGALERRARQSALMREARAQIEELTRRAREADDNDHPAASRLREERKRKRAALREAEQAFERLNAECARLQPRVDELKAGIARLRKYRRTKQRKRRSWIRFDLRERPLAARRKRRLPYVIVPLAVLGFVVSALAGVRFYATRTAGYVAAPAEDDPVRALGTEPGADTALRALGLEARDAPAPVRPPAPDLLAHTDPGTFNRLPALAHAWVQRPAAIRTPPFMSGIIAGELLGDGTSAIGFLDFAGQRLLLYRVTSRGLQFVTEVETGPWPNDAATGDVDNDGDLDIVVLHGDGTPAVHLNTAGGFTRRELPRGGAGAVVALADLNGDGNLDVAATGWKATALYEGGGDGAFLGPLHTNAIPDQDQLAIADFNGDGVQDVATLERLDREPRPRRADLCVTLLTGELLPLRDTVRHRFEPPLRSFAAVDLDGDGSAELVALQEPPPPHTEPVLTCTLLVLDAVAEATPVTTAAGDVQTGTALTVADIDGDGRRDVLAGLDVFLNDGARLNQQASRFGIGEIGGFWDVDFTGDGVRDLIARRADAEQMLLFPGQRRQ